jgi:hypothetical protein
MGLKMGILFLANFTTNHPMTAPEMVVIAKIISAVSKNLASE